MYCNHSSKMRWQHQSTSAIGCIHICTHKTHRSMYKVVSDCLKKPLKFSEICQMSLHFSMGKGLTLKEAGVSAQSHGQLLTTVPRVPYVRSGKLQEASHSESGVLAGHQVPTKAIPLLPSSNEHGRNLHQSRKIQEEVTHELLPWQNKFDLGKLI